jgi:hypothetical protein
MFERVKQNLKEVLEIAEKCPEPYRVKCFEVLLKTLASEQPRETGASPVEAADVKATGVPFFAQQNIQDEQWQKVFHSDGKNFGIIVNDLKEKSTAKKQIKLALLLGIKSLLETSEPIIQKESLIELCKRYSCFDSSNFAQHMKNNKLLFLNRGNNWSLTIPGQQEAAKVIKELA